MMLSFAQQRTGLSFPGRAFRECRTVSRAAVRELERSLKARVAAHADEPWRRVSGITAAVEGTLSWEERRAGIGRLLGRVAEIVRGEGEGRTRPERSDAEGAVNDGGTGRRGDGEKGCEWNEWACVARDAAPLARVCGTLKIARARLSALVSEYCGLSAGEFVDCLRVAGLKARLRTICKAAALRHWMSPGMRAVTLLCGPTVARRGESEHFAAERELNAAAAAYRSENFEAEVGQRARALEAFVWQALRSGGLRVWSAAGEGPSVSRERLALELGIADWGRVRRACVNVWGVTPEQIVREMCGEIAAYYLLCEVKAVRDLAAAEGASRAVMRARWVYGDCEVRPEAPFYDGWETAWVARRAWMERMVGEFG